MIEPQIPRTTGRQRIARCALLAIATLACGTKTGTMESRIASDGQSAGHHHSESCWIDGAETNDDNYVDMMLFIVGLNHQYPNTGLGVDMLGVRELADAIRSAWGHADRIVVVSSAFYRDCSPTSAVCLKHELDSRYGNSDFLVSEVSDFGHGTIGFVTGKRWIPQHVTGLRADSNPSQGIAWTSLRDSVTDSTVDVYALHTLDGDRALGEINFVARHAANVLSKTSNTKRLPPIIAGDFNLTESSLSEPSRETLRRDFLWVNHDVPCSTAPDLPGNVFHAQNGNLMHALLGRISPERRAAYAYSCAEAEFVRVRFSYSMNEKGGLARRDNRSAIDEGILLNRIAHNVIGVGLRLRKRTSTLPDGCFCYSNCLPSCVNTCIKDGGTSSACRRACQTECLQCSGGGSGGGRGGGGGGGPPTCPAGTHKCGSGQRCCGGLVNDCCDGRCVTPPQQCP